LKHENDWQTQPHKKATLSKRGLKDYFNAA
jgi:hypothetical protein